MTDSRPGTEEVSSVRHRQTGLSGRLRHATVLRLDRKRLLLLLGAFLLAFGVRFLTLQFMRAHLNEPGWFQVGSYAKFDRQARAILNGQQIGRASCRERV